MNSKFWEDWFWCALHASIDGSLVVHQYTNRRHQQIAGGNEKCMQWGEHTLHYKTMGFTTQRSAAFFVELINLQLWPQSDGKDRRILAKNNKRQFRSIFGMETCSLSIIESDTIGEKSMRCRQIVAKKITFYTDLIINQLHRIYLT